MRLLTSPVVGSAHVNAIVRVAVHAAAFAALVVLLRPDAVMPAALVVTFLAGVAFLLLAPMHRSYPRTSRAWLETLLYAFLLAAVFAGVDFAMQVLGNSARPRTPLPPVFGGLELYWLLVPGVASVAAGGLAGATLEQCRASRLKPTDAAAAEDEA